MSSDNDLDSLPKSIARRMALGEIALSSFFVVLIHAFSTYPMHSESTPKLEPTSPSSKWASHKKSHSVMRRKCGNLTKILQRHLSVTWSSMCKHWLLRKVFGNISIDLHAHWRIIQIPIIHTSTHIAASKKYHGMTGLKQHQSRHHEPSFRSSTKSIPFHSHLGGS